MGDGSGDGACGRGDVERSGEEAGEPCGTGEEAGEPCGAGEERDERGTGERLGLFDRGLLDGVGGTGENLVDNGTGEGCGVGDFFGVGGADTFEGL